MTTTVYAVLAYALHYPHGDNTKGVFSSYDLAEALLNTLKVNDNGFWKNDVYKIVEWEVQ